MSGNTEWKLVNEQTGIEFKPGDMILNFRDELDFFRRISRAPDIHRGRRIKSGKILTDKGEFYPQVFGLKIVRRES